MFGVKLVAKFIYLLNATHQKNYKTFTQGHETY